MNTIDVALICKALGDSNRLQIIQMLSDGEKCGCKLLEAFEITQPTLSHHMKILKMYVEQMLKSLAPANSNY